MFDKYYAFDLIIELCSNFIDRFYRPCLFTRANLLRELKFKKKTFKLDLKRLCFNQFYYFYV